ELSIATSMSSFLVILILAIISTVIAQVENAPPNELSSHPKSHANNFRKVNPDKMTDEEAEEYRKKYGFNPKHAKTRIQKLRNRYGSSQQRQIPLTEEEQERLEKRKQKYGKLKISRPTNDSLSLFEVNHKTGIDELLVEGDMLLTDDQFDKLENDRNLRGRRKRQAATVSTKWPSNTLYYYFDASIDSSKRQSTLEALAYLQARTCINFVQSSSALNRVRVINGNGCYSSIGMVRGEQILSLGQGCGDIGTIQHEFTHALGSDRDAYVRPDITYVPSGLQSNFAKYSSNANILYTPFDYGSLMEYRADSFVSVPNQISLDPTDDTSRLWEYADGNYKLAEHYDNSWRYEFTKHANYVHLLYFLDTDANTGRRNTIFATRRTTKKNRRRSFALLLAGDVVLRMCRRKLAVQIKLDRKR
ncbi:hypothetical protein WR25_10674, partial [Diploscapter pachys]